jgi:enoyl-CoA hydratase/carnithine racemase
MQRLQHDYLAAYRSLKLTRDSERVLVAEFHSNDGPFTFTAQDHTEFVDAFYRIAQDRSNKSVILTGAGGEFTPDIDFRLSATSPIRAFGARFTKRAFRLWRI